MAELLTGKVVSDTIKEQLKVKVADLKKKGIIPKLGIVRVGARPDDVYYESGAKKACDAVGMSYQVFEYPVDVDQVTFEQGLSSVAANSEINGILMFAPLPKHLDEAKLRELIPAEKDVDCMTKRSMGKVFADDPAGFAPCTPVACMEILKFYNIPIKGKKAVVLGRSLIVGKPISQLLLRENATVTICHSSTKDLPREALEADILISAVGKPRMINAKYATTGQVVIDVGINQDPDNPNKYCGDVDFAAVEGIVEKITPVPGGVGSVTTAVLCKHTIRACEIQYGLL